MVSRAQTGTILLCSSPFPPQLHDLSTGLNVGRLNSYPFSVEFLGKVGAVIEFAGLWFVYGRLGQLVCGCSKLQTDVLNVKH